MSNFTDKQILKVEEILNELENCTKEVGSNCNVENFKMLKDNGNIYISYTSITSGFKKEVEDIYLKVDKNGRKWILNYETNFTTDELAVIFKRYEPFTM